MNIDDKDVDKLLKDINLGNIEVPSELEIELSNKLMKLKPKKNKKWVIASSIVVGIILSYNLITPFRTFADNVIEYILGDKGIDNAKNNGYESLGIDIVSIQGNEIKVSNIYADNLRISFDVDVKLDKDIKANYIESDTEYYIVEVDTDRLYEDLYDVDIRDMGESTEQKSMSSGYTSYNIEEDTKTMSGNIQIMGEAVLDILKEEKIKIPIRLVKEYNKSDDNKDNYDIIGSEYIEVNKSDVLVESKVIDINDNIDSEGLSINIDRLDISPTMMYLYTSGGIDSECEAQGLYNLEIVSSEGKVYKDNLSLSSWTNDSITKQTIVPSIYYDESESFKLKADGVLVRPNREDIEINLSDTYPKKIEYFDTEVEITKVEYINNELIIGLRDNDEIDMIGDSLIDGEISVSGGGYEDNVEGESFHTLYYDVEKKDSYKFSLEMIMKYPLNIDIEIKNE